MKKKGIIATIIILVVLVLVGVVGYNIYQNISQTAKLVVETQKISNMDIEKDNVDMQIYTKGNYAVVEKAMKDYFNEYAENVKSVSNIVNDEKLGTLLTADNIQNDGPEFGQTIEYINSTKEEFKGKMDRMIELCSEEAINKQIEDKEIGDTYKELYKKLMMDENIPAQLQKVKTQMETSSNQVTTAFDTVLEIINLLKENNGKWSVKENKVVFQDTSLLTQYNSLVLKLSRM